MWNKGSHSANVFGTAILGGDREKAAFPSFAQLTANEALGVVMSSAILPILTNLFSQIAVFILSSLRAPRTRNCDMRSLSLPWGSCCIWGPIACCTRLYCNGSCG